MAAGRPLKFQSVEELQTNGNYQFTGKKLFNTKFINEMSLQLYITDNMVMFCKDVLDDELISFKTNKDFYVKGKRRPDIIINCKRKQYIIELKNPKYAIDNSNAIGQILGYSLDVKGDKELIIVSTLFCDVTARVIKEFKLPIRYIYFDHGISLEFKGF